MNKLLTIYTYLKMNDNTFKHIQLEKWTKCWSKRYEQVPRNLNMVRKVQNILLIITQYKTMQFTLHDENEKTRKPSYKKW
jgi:hypothetical protein